MKAFEVGGLRVMYVPLHVPYYINLIEVSLDRFRNRNSQVSLLFLGHRFSLKGSGYYGDDESYDSGYNVAFGDYGGCDYEASSEAAISEHCP